MKRFFIVLTVAMALSLVAIPVFSQENKEAAPAVQEAQSPTVSPAVPAPDLTPAPAANEVVPQPEEISIYGEVKSIDDAASSVKLQYYDYDNDEERTTDIVIDKDTKMENAAVLNDIKQGDWIDAVYSVKDAKFVAKSVIVEKEEESSPAMPEEKKAEEQPAGMPDLE
ncbi:MAG: hypothetical protein Q8Q87_00935 [Candidatus Omnitrophota bacterium]|nr:hypothetical protein [Candidatus Omnitrophota bacterium]